MVQRQLITFYKRVNWRYIDMNTHFLIEVRKMRERLKLQRKILSILNMLFFVATCLFYIVNNNVVTFICVFAAFLTMQLILLLNWKIEKPERAEMHRYFTFTDFFGRKGQCGILTERWIGDRFLVVFVELLDNKGVSVTNSIEEITNQYGETLKLAGIISSLQDLVIVENYEGRIDYDLVRFEKTETRFSGPNWRRLNQKELEFYGLDDTNQEIGD